jgi:hypothetical protein
MAWASLERPAERRTDTLLLLRTLEVGDRHDVFRAAGELDELGEDAAPGHVERRVDAVGCEDANPPNEALAVGDGFGAE